MRNLQTWVLLVIVACACPCIESSSFRHHRAQFYVPSLNTHTIEQVPRGGSVQEEEVSGKSYISAGVVGRRNTSSGAVAGKSSGSSKIRALLENSTGGNDLLVLPTGQESLLYAAQITGRSSSSDADTIAETLGMVCNVLVVWVSPHENDDSQSIIEALLRGIQRRIEVGLLKPTILVVSLDRKQNDDENAHKQQLVLGMFREFTPPNVDRLEVITSEAELQQIWKEVLHEQQHAPPLVDLPAFPALLQQVHDALTGNTSCTPPELALVWEDEEYKLSLLEKEVNSELDILMQQEMKEEEHVIAEDGEVSFETDDDGKDAEFSSSREGLQVKKRPPTRRRVEAVFVTELTRQVLADSLTKIRDLQVQQQDVWLREESDDSVTPPLVQFGTLANAILHEALHILTEQQVSTKLQVMEQIVQELHRLYTDQLESLREYFGKQYESILSRGDNTEERQTQAAKLAVEGFQEAALQAVPLLCRQGQELHNLVRFDHVATLQGLISDMMEATSSSNEHDLEVDENDDDNSPRRIPKWMEKLAARAVVLGVNYFQGWLAWQGIRKAAAERDRNMPKFPLF